MRFQWHSVDQFLRAEIPTAHSSKLVLRDWSSQFFVIALQAGSMWFACERVLAADGPAALDRRRTRQYAS
jgi:hypothetical protein